MGLFSIFKKKDNVANQVPQNNSQNNSQAVNHSSQNPVKAQANPNLPPVPSLNQLAQASNSQSTQGQSAPVLNSNSKTTGTSVPQNPFANQQNPSNPQMPSTLDSLKKMTQEDSIKQLDSLLKSSPELKNPLAGSPEHNVSNPLNQNMHNAPNPLPLTQHSLPLHNDPSQNILPTQHTLSPASPTPQPDPSHNIQPNPLHNIQSNPLQSLNRPLNNPSQNQTKHNNSMQINTSMQVHTQKTDEDSIYKEGSLLFIERTKYLSVYSDVEAVTSNFDSLKKVVELKLSSDPFLDKFSKLSDITEDLNRTALLIEKKLFEKQTQ